MSSDEKADQTSKKDSNSQEKSSTEALVSIVQYDMIENCTGQYIFMAVNLGTWFTSGEQHYHDVSSV